jgi:hypothetical protein
MAGKRAGRYFYATVTHLTNGTLRCIFLLINLAFRETPTGRLLPTFDQHTLRQPIRVTTSLTTLVPTLSIAMLSMIAPQTGTRILYCMKWANEASWLAAYC